MSIPDGRAKQALSEAGAFCGECGFEPGDEGCEDCKRCYESYIQALRAAGWFPREEVLAEAADLAETVGTDLHGKSEVERSTGAFDVMSALRYLINNPTKEK